MQGQKNSNLIKVVAFFLIAIFLTVFIAFSASGWQENENERPQIDNSTSEKNPTEENVDENNEGQNNITPAPDNTTESIKHFLTGTEIEASAAGIMPYAIVVDSLAPLYGFSDAYIAIEMPIENGNTRYLIITDNADTIGKIGSISSSRAYIKDIAGFFSSLLLYHGVDDKFLYSSLSDPPSIDLSIITGYCYSEQGKYIYTNGDLISALLLNTGVTRAPSGILSSPFNPTGYNDAHDAKIANTISITYSESNQTSLHYNAFIGKYTLKKNNEEIIDLHNTKAPVYDGALILGIDSTTKDTESATELILDTKSGGRGYYAAQGTVIDVTWNVDDTGKMIVSSDGKILSTNPGSTYVSFVKSSQINSINFN